MNPSGNERPLVYPLYNPLNIGSTATDESPSLLSLDGWTTTDNDQRVDIVLNISLNEYIALATCIDIGRDIAYGENSDYIWWLWSRSIVSINLCQSILDCINDPSSGVGDAINSIARSEAYELLREFAQSQNSIGFADGSNPTCDLDVLWAQSFQLIEYFDQLNNEVFAILEVDSNIYELIADVVGNITFIDETSVDAILAWIEFVLNNISENYDAQATTAYLEKLACDIFCKARDENCEITPKLCFDILSDRLGASVTIGSLIDETLDYLTSGSWEGSEIADFMFFAQFGLRSQLGKFLNIDAYVDVNQRLGLAVNDANDDWLLLCEDCVFDWQSTLDLTSSDYGFTFIDGAWSNGVGFIPTTGTGGDNRLVARLTLDDCTVKSISWDAQITIPSNPDGDATAEYQIRNDGSFQTGSIILRYPEDTPIGTTVLNQSTSGYSSPCDQIQLFLRPDNVGSSGSGFISHITIAGIGTKPSQLP